MANPSFQAGGARAGKGFTLIELLAATAVFSLILMVTLSALGQASGLWKNASAKIEAFQSARNAFDLVTRNLSQATLNTYLDYDNPNTPTRYLRQSDLRFVSGLAGVGLPGTPTTGSAAFFQAPANYTTNTASFGSLESLLNTCGYFVQFSDDPLRPPHVKSAGKFRFRLMQLLTPTENDIIFTSTNATDYKWFSDYAGTNNYGKTLLPVADNIIALVIEPRDPAPGSAPLSPGYIYNTGIDGLGADGKQLITAHQLPPVVQVTMVAIDEASAVRLENGGAVPSVIANALAGKFQNASTYEQNLADLRSALSQAGIQYRVFSSAVPIRESKWTK